MEYQVLDERTTQESSLCLDSEGVNNLKTGRGWALFIAILRLVGLAILIVFSIVIIIGAIFSGSSSGWIMGLYGLICLIFSGVLLIPLIYMIKFTNHAARACNQKDSVSLNSAIKNLRSYFKTTGIIVIVFVVLYLIFIILLLAFSSSLLGGLGGFKNF
jgi:hypothetical protein